MDDAMKRAKRNANTTAKRFTAVCIPGRGNEAAAWFLFDTLAFRSVRAIAGGYDEARDAAREANKLQEAT